MQDHIETISLINTHTQRRFEGLLGLVIDSDKLVMPGAAFNDFAKDARTCPICQHQLLYKSLQFKATITSKSTP